MQNRLLQIIVLITIVVIAILIVILVFKNPGGELKDSVKTIQDRSSENTNQTSPST